jgi:photoactive yellow protein
MPESISVDELPFGLVELDEAGTVIYYKHDREDGVDAQAPELVGRNFFTDVRPVAETEGFKNQIRGFRQSHAPSRSFSYSFNLGGFVLSVRVLLARIHEQSPQGGRDSVLVHIRKDASPDAPEMDSER